MVLWRRKDNHDAVHQYQHKKQDEEATEPEEENDIIDKKPTRADRRKMEKA